MISVIGRRNCNISGDETDARVRPTNGVQHMHILISDKSMRLIVRAPWVFKMIPSAVLIFAIWLSKFEGEGGGRCDINGRPNRSKADT